MFSVQVLHWALFKNLEEKLPEVSSIQHIENYSKNKHFHVVIEYNNHKCGKVEGAFWGKNRFCSDETGLGSHGVGRAGMSESASQFGSNPVDRLF